MEAVEKISRAYKRDKAVRVRQEAHKRNQFTADALPCVFIQTKQTWIRKKDPGDERLYPRKLMVALMIRQLVMPSIVIWLQMPMLTRNGSLPMNLPQK